MDPDTFLVLGLIVAAFSVPSIMSALSDGRVPRASAITILIAGALILYAIQSQPGGYAMSQIPDVFVRVVARYVP
ncbi:MAG: hypothetical protein ABJR46_06700 [Tateyamaria sp.]|uniref:hypothetical protein n=1 Tax=Tateyamaria sp. TaxID=1929288 RepID=UPI00327BEF94